MKVLPAILGAATLEPAGGHEKEGAILGSSAGRRAFRPMEASGSGSGDVRSKKMKHPGYNQRVQYPKPLFIFASTLLHIVVGANWAEMLVPVT
jgi:hypothetical protein